MRNETSENKIRKLENQLYDARQVIVSLMPPKVNEIAQDYFWIQTRADAYEWLEKLIEATIEIAWPLAEKTLYSGARADCPLCKRGSLDPYAEGFLLPGGLRKHLLGEGNAHECEVLAAARAISTDYWRPMVEQAEAYERAAKEAQKQQRRQAEDLFRTSPSGTAYLLDEYIFGAEPRDNASMSWALGRLKQLGFTEVLDGQIRQYIRDYGDIVVFADPRQRGRLEFAVYRKEQVEKPKSKRRWSPDYQSLHLQDSWRNDLERKLNDRVEAARTVLVKPVKR